MLSSDAIITQFPATHNHIFTAGSIVLRTVKHFSNSVQKSSPL